jgi:ATP-dependent Clp protease adaptor protein ClpS
MTKHQPEQGLSGAEEMTPEHELILYNDDVNTFDFVIQTLVDVCEHDILQAEQCAMITHFNGECGVKRGDFDFLREKHLRMSHLGLVVQIK